MDNWIQKPMKGLLLKSTLVSFLDQLSSTKERIKANIIVNNVFRKKGQLTTSGGFFLLRKCPQIKVKMVTAFIMEFSFQCNFLN